MSTPTVLTHSCGVPTSIRSLIFWAAALFSSWVLAISYSNSRTFRGTWGAGTASSCTQPPHLPPSWVRAQASFRDSMTRHQLIREKQVQFKQRLQDWLQFHTTWGHQRKKVMGPLSRITHTHLHTLGHTHAHMRACAHTNTPPVVN